MAERIPGWILAPGFLAAPALALLYGPGPALVVLAGSLAITILLARSAHGSAADQHRRRLNSLIALNSLLLIAAILGLVILIR